MGARLKLVPLTPQGFVVPSEAMPCYLLTVRRLGQDPRPLTPEDRQLLVSFKFEPDRELTVTNYNLRPPTQYAVLATRRWPRLSELP